MTPAETLARESVPTHGNPCHSHGNPCHSHGNPCEKRLHKELTQQSLQTLQVLGAPRWQEDPATEIQAPTDAEAQAAYAALADSLSVLRLDRARRGASDPLFGRLSQIINNLDAISRGVVKRSAASWTAALAPVDAQRGAGAQ